MEALQVLCPSQSIRSFIRFARGSYGLVFPNLQNGSAEGQVALDYWTKERRFDLETADEFRIGYAPVDRFRISSIPRQEKFPRKFFKKQVCSTKIFSVENSYPDFAEG